MVRDGSTPDTRGNSYLLGGYHGLPLGFRSPSLVAMDASDFVNGNYTHVHCYRPDSRQHQCEGWRLTKPWLGTHPAQPSRSWGLQLILINEDLCMGFLRVINFNITGSSLSPREKKRVLLW